MGIKPCTEEKIKGKRTGWPLDQIDCFQGGYRPRLAPSSSSRPHSLAFKICQVTSHCRETLEHTQDTCIYHSSRQVPQILKDIPTQGRKLKDLQQRRHGTVNETKDRKDKIALRCFSRHMQPLRSTLLKTDLQVLTTPFSGYI